MASEVSIANFALRRLGANGITSFSDGTTEGIIVADTFAGIRDSLLREHLWNFATRRTGLAAAATAPAWGYAFAYPVPVDFLRLREVEGQQLCAVEIENQAAEGRVILSDLEAPLNIAYIARIEDADLMDVSFHRALSLRCAMEWCEKLTASSALFDMVSGEYVSALRDARTTDGQEESPKQFTPDFFIRARR